MTRRDDARLVGIVRRSRTTAGDVRLVAVVSSLAEASQSSPRVTTPPKWALEEVPLEALPPPLAKDAAHIKQAWDALGEVRALRTESIADFLTVLLGTVPDLRFKWSRSVVPKAKAVEPEPHRATAAHPRAFRGTKHKPPKASKPEPMDLRLELFELGAIGRRLLENRDLLEPAVSFLAARGYARERLARIVGRGDPYLAVHHGARAEARLTDFPPDFVRLLLPALRQGEVDMVDVAGWTAQWSVAGCDEPLRAALTRLALLAPREGLRLSPLWMGAEDARRAIIVRALTAFDVRAIAARFTEGQWLTHAESLSQSLAGAGDEVWADRLSYLLRTVTADGPVLYSLDWIAIAGPQRDRSAPDEVGLDAEARWNDVEGLAIRAADKSWFPTWLLGTCGCLPGLARWIRETDWDRFSPATAVAMVERVARLAWDDLPAEHLQAKWLLVREELPRLVDWLLAEVPETHRQSALVLMLEFFSDWGRDVAQLAARLPVAYAIVRRVALPPFRPNACNDWLVTPLVRGLHDHPDALRRFLRAPERCFRVMDRAVRRDNDALLVGRGFGILLLYLRDLAVDTFAAYPTRVMTLSRTLGALDYDEGCARARDLAQHPMIRLRSAGALPAAPASLREQARVVVDALRGYVGPRTPNPVPRRLADFVQGKAPLRDSQVVRHLRRVQARLDPLVLAALEKSIVERAGAAIGLDSTSDAARHALLMERSADENRRPLRRLLKAVATGDHRYLERHPATLAYRRAHPALDDRTWGRWLEGLRVEASYGGARIRLGMEGDPLEVLRMGTYAGTCLGLGGGFVHSAAAIALDLNKRVVYARRETGSVVARQLLALNDEDRLVCFHVYPLDAPREIKELFARYDRELASALGLPIQTEGAGSDGEPPIAEILSRGFWHDGAWDLQAHA
jgi:hypothetical protein